MAAMGAREGVGGRACAVTELKIRCSTLYSKRTEVVPRNWMGKKRGFAKRAGSNIPPAQVNPGAGAAAVPGFVRGWSNRDEVRRGRGMWMQWLLGSGYGLALGVTDTVSGDASLWLRVL